MFISYKNVSVFHSRYIVQMGRLASSMWNSETGSIQRKTISFKIQSLKYETVIKGTTHLEPFYIRYYIWTTAEQSLNYCYIVLYSRSPCFRFDFYWFWLSLFTYVFTTSIGWLQPLYSQVLCEGLTCNYWNIIILHLLFDKQLYPILLRIAIKIMTQLS